MKKCNSPVSRVLFSHCCEPLSFISTWRCRQALTTYPPGLGGQPSTPGIFGLSTHKVYPPDMSPYRAVSSYLTFSPLSRHKCRDGYFLWHYLFPATRDLPVRKYGALCCPDFPPINDERQGGLLPYKSRHKVDKVNKGCSFSGLQYFESKEKQGFHEFTVKQHIWFTASCRISRGKKKCLPLHFQ